MSKDNLKIQEFPLLRLPLANFSNYLLLIFNILLITLDL